MLPRKCVKKCVAISLTATLSRSTLDRVHKEQTVGSKLEGHSSQVDVARVRRTIAYVDGVTDV